MKTSKTIKLGILVLSLIMVFASCKNPGSTGPIDEKNPGGVVTHVQAGTVPQITDITLPSQAVAVTDNNVNSDVRIEFEQEKITISGDGATAEGCSLTITKAGKYLISGKCSDGVIYVNTTDEDNVKLILNGLELTSKNGPAIYVLSAPKKVVISSLEGSVSVISDMSSYGEDSFGNSPDAAIFAKDDLKLEGEGIIYVQGSYDKGIHCKDDLVIESGSLFVTAKGDGISGKNSLCVLGGEISVECDGDGMVSNREEEGKEHGVVNVSGGVIKIKSGGGSSNSLGNNGDDGFGGGMMPGGNRPGGGGFRPGGRTYESDPQLYEQSTEVSTKGIKSVGKLTVTGGDITIDSCDDAIHSNSDIEISGGNLTLASGDDGIHGDMNVVINDGQISITKSYEGIEGQYVTVNGGSACIVSSDDGINATDGSGSAMGGGGRPGGFGGGMSAQDCLLTVNGGYVFMNAAGDGIDSNGNAIQNGGTVIVYGPTNSGNGAIDTGDGGCSYTLKGGTVLAAGAYGMAEGVETEGNAVSFSVRMNNVSGGTLIYVLDSQGKCVLAFENPKQFSGIVYASDSLPRGEYTFFQGGECEGECINGVYTAPVASGGKEMGSVDI